MAVDAVLSGVGIATLSTDITGNIISPESNVFQDRSVAAGHWSHSLQVKIHWTSDLRHGCPCCAKCCRYCHTWYRHTRKQGHAQNQYVPRKKFFFRWTLVRQFTDKKHCTSDLRHGFPCCAKCCRYCHTWYRRTRKHGHAQNQYVPRKKFCRWTSVTQFTDKKIYWTSDLRHGCPCCVKFCRYRHTWYRRTWKHGHAQKQYVPR